MQQLQLCVSVGSKALPLQAFFPFAFVVCVIAPPRQQANAGSGAVVKNRTGMQYCK